MDRVSVITEALQKLDHTNDEMWSEDGAPLLSVINYYAGLEDVTRKEVAKINPKLTRKWLASQFAKDTQDATNEKTADSNVTSETVDHSSKLQELRANLEKAQRELDEYQKIVAKDAGAVLVNNFAQVRRDAAKAMHEARMEKAKKLEELKANGLPVDVIASLVTGSMKRKQRRGR